MQAKTTGRWSSRYEHPRTSALLRSIGNIRICMGKKPIVSVTYENERISIKNSLPYLKCVLHLSCVVHGPIYGRFMGCTVNGFLCYKSAHGPHRRDVTHILSQSRCISVISFHFYRLTIGFFPHKNPYISNVMQQYRCSAMRIFRAWATCAKTNLHICDWSVSQSAWSVFHLW